MKRKILYRFLSVACLICSFGCEDDALLDESDALLDEDENIETTSSPLVGPQVDVRVNRVFRAASGAPDHMDTFNPGEGGYQTAETHLWYLPRYSNSSRHPLYRLYSNGDHMTSISTGEGGYNYEFRLGYAFDDITYGQGILPMVRWRYAGNNDHLTGGLGEVPPGYNEEDELGHAWYGGFVPIEDGVHLKDWQIDEISKDGITLGTSRVWGGVITKLEKNGYEYINRIDAGREIQSTFEQWNPSSPPNVNWVENPTEGGDCFGNGSPIVRYDRYPSQGRVYTRSNALRWGNYLDNQVVDPLGPTKRNPIVSGTIIGKEATISSANTIEVTNYIKTAKPYTYEADMNMNDNISAFLTTDFDRLEIWGKWGASESRLAGPIDVEHGPQRDDGPRGSVTIPAGYNRAYILVYSDDDDRALALLRKNPSVGRTSLSYDLRPRERTGNPYSESCLWIAAHDHYYSNIPANYEREYEYTFVVGTKSQVTNALRGL